ncbi:IS3 family transposase [Streptomyces sp. NPDC017890]|uniref:IS3 family transposase n=1 Tax=Streptomyces sp. NPDC017890 TaxID=3365015 RepID=UPI0037892FCA
MTDSYDNALAENLWMLIKTEGLRGRTFATRAETNPALFEYIDGFYNSRCIQKRLGDLSPAETPSARPDRQSGPPSNVETADAHLTFRVPGGSRLSFETRSDLLS